MKADPREWFEAISLPMPYESWREEVAAISAGRKAMSVFIFGDVGEIEEPSHDEVVDAARGIGLLVSSSFDRDEVAGVVQQWRTVLVAAVREAWRLQAYPAVMRVLHSKPWSEASERMQSSLLGYDALAFSAWIDALRRSQAGWGTQVHFWMRARRLEGLREIGGRGVHRGLVETPFEVGALGRPWGSGRGAVKAGAVEDMPRGWVLCRAAIEVAYGVDLFRAVSGTDRAFTRWAVVERLEAFNKALRSRVEVLSATGWA